MKREKLLTGFLFFGIILGMISCKETPKNIESPETEKGYVIDAKTTSLKWTAYKTTAKTPVKGEFIKIEVDTTKQKASSVSDALNNLKFKIPVEGIFTNDSIRDGKLKKFFFGTLENTTEIVGVINVVNENSGTVAITLNGITQPLPFTMVISDQMVTIEAVLDLDNWKAQTALSALNTACGLLHTGEDGISKTWSEVKIEVATLVKKE